MLFLCLLIHGASVNSRAGLRGCQDFGRSMDRVEGKCASIQVLWRNKAEHAMHWKHGTIAEMLGTERAARRERIAYSRMDKEGRPTAGLT